jgi:hypothetical protein
VAEELRVNRILNWVNDKNKVIDLNNNLALKTLGIRESGAANLIVHVNDKTNIGQFCAYHLN